MRSLLLLPALLLATAACGEKAETEEAMPEAAAPAMLTAADVAGTWNGMTMAEGSDSVTSTWTVTSTSDTTWMLKWDDRPDSLTYTARYDADSMVVESFPMVDPTREDGMMVKFRSVARLQADGQLVGNGTQMIVGSDEVVSQYTWHATRAPM